jgi:hypothetical protein
LQQEVIQYIIPFLFEFWGFGIKFSLIMDKIWKRLTPIALILRSATGPRQPKKCIFFLVKLQDSCNIFYLKESATFEFEVLVISINQFL